VVIGKVFVVSVYKVKLKAVVVDEIKGVIVD
jgi:hypothetical protein